MIRILGIVCPAGVGRGHVELQNLMKQKHIGQLILVFLMVAGALFYGRSTLYTREICPMGMIYIPGGDFFTGTSEKEFLYLVKLCDMTVGGCYESWFKNEMPKRIAHVDSFCIDRYEFPNRAGRQPQSRMTWYDAQNICAGAGKRLCREVEWERACAGQAENVWSYGYRYVQNQCNINSETLETSGSNEKCRSIDGVMDMNGNLAEWVADSYGNVSSLGEYERLRILKGGSYRDRSIFSRCNSVDLRSPEDRHVEFGVRCCHSGEIIGYENEPPGGGVGGRRENVPDIDISSE